MALVAGCAPPKRPTRTPAPYESQKAASGYEAAPPVVPAASTPPPNAQPVAPSASTEALSPSPGNKPTILQSACTKKSFPAAAISDEATVTLLVVVDEVGTLKSVSVLLEKPEGEGFGKAARACVLKSTFAPAHDDAGNPVEAKTLLNIRFIRPPSD